MELQQIVELAMKSGIELIVIGYFIFKDYTTTKAITEALTKLNETTQLIKDLVLKGEH